MLDLEAIRAEGYGFQIEMTYRSSDLGAKIKEVPITFVDRVAGESKMSSRIVFEALALVTWWGLGRATRGIRRPTSPTFRRPLEPVPSTTTTTTTTSGSSDPLGST